MRMGVATRSLSEVVRYRAPRRLPLDVQHGADNLLEAGDIG